MSAAAVDAALADEEVDGAGVEAFPALFVPDEDFEDLSDLEGSPLFEGADDSEDPDDFGDLDDAVFFVPEEEGLEASFLAAAVVAALADADVDAVGLVALPALVADLVAEGVEWGGAPSLLLDSPPDSELGERGMILVDWPVLVGDTWSSTVPATDSFSSRMETTPSSLWLESDMSSSCYEDKPKEEFK